MTFNKIPFLIIIVIIGLLVSQDALAQKNKNTASATQLEADSTIYYGNMINSPVVAFNDTLFYIYGDVGVVTAKQRAHIIGENITTLGKDMLFNEDSLAVIEEQGIYEIVYYGKIILGVTDMQSNILKKSKEQIANEYRLIIINKVKETHDNNGWKNLLIQIALLVLVIAITYFLIKLINFVFRKIRAVIIAQRNYTIKALYYIIDADKQMKVVLFLVKIIKLAFILLIIYFCLFTLFRIFPETKWLSDTLIGYIMSPLKKAIIKVIEFIPDLISIIVIIVIFRFIIKVVRIVAERIDDKSITFKGFYSDWAIPTYNIVKVVLYIFMFIVIFPHLPGSDSDIFKGVSVFLGVLFSLGSTSIIGNIVSGLVITYMRPFKIGDRIKMGEFLGNVVEKTPLVTRVRTPKNELITIPNANVMSSQTVNYTRSAESFGLILHTTLTVGYEIPWRKVHEVLLEAGSNIENVLKDPKPFILQIALDDFYVQYQINVYTTDANQMSNIYSDLNKNIQDIFNREGIELVSPHYRAQRDGSNITMPEEYIKTEKFRTAPFSINIVKETSKE